jgi:hypothetical protein
MKMGQLTLIRFRPRKPVKPSKLWGVFCSCWLIIQRIRSWYADLAQRQKAALGSWRSSSGHSSRLRVMGGRTTELESTCRVRPWRAFVIAQTIFKGDRMAGIFL